VSILPDFDDLLLRTLLFGIIVDAEAMHNNLASRLSVPREAIWNGPIKVEGQLVGPDLG
jgi:hypothetical protein